MIFFLKNTILGHFSKKLKNKCSIGFFGCPIQIFDSSEIHHLLNIYPAGFSGVPNSNKRYVTYDSVYTGANFPMLP